MAATQVKTYTGSQDSVTGQRPGIIFERNQQDSFVEPR